MTRTITIASGKAGVGKTCLAVNAALALASHGHSTCLFDADFSAANINAALGLTPKLKLEDVMISATPFSDILVHLNGLDIVPAGSCLENVSNMESDALPKTISALSGLSGYDYLIFDTPADVSRNVISLCLSSTSVLLMATPGQASLADAYGFLEILAQNGYKNTVGIIMSQCKTPQDAKQAYAQLKKAVDANLALRIAPFGAIAYDQNVQNALKQHKAVLSLYPNSDAARCITQVAKKITQVHAETLELKSMPSFWESWMHIIKSPLDLTKQDLSKPTPEQALALFESEEEPECLTVEVGPDAEEDLGVQPQPFTMMDNGTLALLNKLADGVAAVSQELSLVRKAIERLADNGAGFGGTSASAPLPPGAISLDFESYSRNS